MYSECIVEDMLCPLPLSQVPRQSTLTTLTSSPSCKFQSSQAQSPQAFATMPLLSTLRALTFTFSWSTPELHSSSSLRSVGIRDAADFASVQTPGNAIKFKVELLSLQPLPAASKSEEVEAVGRIAASSDLLEAPVPDKLVATNNDVQSLNTLWRWRFYKSVSEASATSF